MQKTSLSRFRHRYTPVVCLFLGLGFLVASTPASTVHAQSEQDDIYRCVKAGRCLPLSDILAIVQARIPGRIVGSGIDEGQARFGVFIYRMTVLQEGGRAVRVDVDARSGRIVSIQG